MVTEDRERSYLFDNYKCMLIILVVFGHILEEYGIFGTSEHIRAVIYSFHMPAFIFISGYFSKNLTKCYEQAVKTCLLPFLVFNTIWLIITMDTWRVNVLFPAYVFWYLLSLFFWRITIRFVSRIRFTFLVLLLIALYVGCFHEADRFLSISRTLVFYPLFYLGFWVSEEQVAKLRSYSKWIAAVLVLAGLGVTLYLNVTGRIPVKTYENLQCYHCSGIGNVEGILIRLFEILLAIIIIFGLLNLIPDKKYKITSLGSRTVTIYLLSSFFIRGFHMATDKLHWTEKLQGNDALLLSVSLAVCIVIVYLCSRKWVCRLYSQVFNWLAGIIMKNQKLAKD